VPSLDRAGEPRELPAWWCWLVLAGLAAGLVWGASRLAFLCDDAYIHFRYAANAHDGHGLVWNAAPFAPVEGYGFLWVVTLWVVWSWFGVEPPDAANVLSIGFGVVQLLLLAILARELTARDGRRLPAVVGLCALAAIVGNRTFLQWLSSGLDTALFNMWSIGWVVVAFRPAAVRGPKWLAAWSAFAALAGLTRPDGLPLVAATFAVALWLVASKRLAARPAVLGLLPLAAVVVHTLWRRSFYGEWLPNTYYAKVVTAWPEAGWRYFACFALENGAWLWFPIVAVWLVAELRRGRRVVLPALLANAPAVAAIGVVAFNASYYLFKVGGDHFEYRVLSLTVPLGVLACVAMVARLGNGARLPIATAAALALAGGVGWWHYAVTSDPEPVQNGVKPVTPHVPELVKPLARWFDRQQLWLFARYVGLRSQHHATVLAIYAHNSPPARGSVAAQGEYPVLATGAVGLPSWLLADCAIIDEYGLNDWVIARWRATLRPLVSEERLRAAVAAADADADGFLDLLDLRRAYAAAFDTPEGDATGDFLLRFVIAVHEDSRPGAMTRDEAVSCGAIFDAPRRMAHERVPPPGYVAAFDPNVTVVGGVVNVRPRTVPLTSERIRAIETEWRGRIEREERR
jgi:arabinofuranosyltransferase